MTTLSIPAKVTSLPMLHYSARRSTHFANPLVASPANPLVAELRAEQAGCLNGTTSRGIALGGSFFCQLTTQDAPLSYQHAQTDDVAGGNSGETDPRPPATKRIHPKPPPSSTCSNGRGRTFNFGPAGNSSLTTSNINNRNDNKNTSSSPSPKNSSEERLLAREIVNITKSFTVLSKTCPSDTLEAALSDDYDDAKMKLMSDVTLGSLAELVDTAAETFKHEKVHSANLEARVASAAVCTLHEKSVLQPMAIRDSSSDDGIYDGKNNGELPPSFRHERELPLSIEDAGVSGFLGEIVKRLKVGEPLRMMPSAELNGPNTAGHALRKTWVKNAANNSVAMTITATRNSTSDTSAFAPEVRRLQVVLPRSSTAPAAYHELGSASDFFSGSAAGAALASPAIAPEVDLDLGAVSLVAIQKKPIRGTRYGTSKSTTFNLSRVKRSTRGASGSNAEHETTPSTPPPAQHYEFEADPGAAGRWTPLSTPTNRSSSQSSQLDFSCRSLTPGPKPPRSMSSSLSPRALGARLVGSSGK